MLVGLGINFPHTHDIGALVGLIPPSHPLRERLATLTELTPFAVAYRYPAEDEQEVPNGRELEAWRARIALLLAQLRAR